MNSILLKYTTTALLLLLLGNVQAHNNRMFCAFSSDVDTSMLMEFHSFEQEDMSVENFTIYGKIRINDTILVPEVSPTFILSGNSLSCRGATVLPHKPKPCLG